MEQQNGKLYAATRGIECISRVTLTASGQLDQHILASTHELSFEARHQPLDRDTLPKQDHE
jgi:hypothetical protein